MNRLFKKSALALLLVLAMMLMMVPAMAEDTDEDTTETTSTYGDAVIDPNALGSISLYKYMTKSITDDPNDPSGTHADGTTNSAPNGYVALKDIKFQVYLVESIADFDIDSQTAIANSLSGIETYRNLDLSDSGALASFITALPDGALKETIKTGEDGYAQTPKTLPVGIYLVCEVENDTIQKSVNPFFVTIPITDPVTASGTGGTRWLYDITVYPKNSLPKNPEIQKDVTVIDNEDDSVRVGDDATWIILPEVPKDIKTAVNYTITDPIDENLKYVEASLRIVINPDRAENEVEVTLPVTGYIVDEPTAKNDNTLTITLTDEGKDTLRNSLIYPTDGMTLPRIAIYFDTTVLTGALKVMGDAIPNQAFLDYTNSASIIYDKEPSDIPEVHVGGINLLKIDSEGVVIPTGAKFQIYKSEEAAKAQDPNGLVSAYASDVATVESDTFTTGEDGKLSIYGLAYGDHATVYTEYEANKTDTGTYWLVETKAPTTGDGTSYNLLKTPIKVTVTADSHLDFTGDQLVKVTNRQGFELPITGGVGTVIFTVGGILLLALAAFLLLKKKGSAKA